LPLYRSIVVGTDGSDTAEGAVREAVELAKLTGARLHVVTAYPRLQSRERLGTTARREPVDLREVAEAVTQRVSKRVASEGIDVETHEREGDPSEVLIDIADETETNLIVVGSKGMRGAARFLLGSVPGKVSHHARASVLIVRTTT
jgi:nucleotide-binding universal stress UspA family protein